MRHERHMGALALRVFLLLAMSVQSPFGLTLCLAEDGHASLELAHGGVACTSEIRRHHSEAAIVTGYELATYPCRDVPVLAQASYRANEPHLLPAPSFAALAFPLAEMAGARTWRPGRAGATGPPATTTRGIRSVVLLV